MFGFPGVDDQNVFNLIVLEALSHVEPWLDSLRIPKHKEPADSWFLNGASDWLNSL